MKPKYMILVLSVFLSFATSSAFATLRITESSLNMNYESNSVELSQEILYPMSMMRPEITKEEKHKATQKIKHQNEIIDAVIMQNDAKVKLVLTVKEGTTKERAKELGESFVRLIKTFCRDPNPNKEIGIGVYDYMIEVYYPDKNELAIGIKVCMNKSISWKKSGSSADSVRIT